MREILFRGKRDKRYGEGWTYGVPYIDHEGDCIIATHCSKRVVDPETVGQYTGLTDKNGKKIFEGDIVDVLYDIKYTGVAAKRIGLFKVVFYKGCFMKDKITKINDEKGLFHFIPSDVCTVIGNIHDNPELLEV